MKKLLNVLPWLNGIGAATFLISGLVGMIMYILGIPEVVAVITVGSLKGLLLIASIGSIVIGATLLIEKYMTK